MTEPIRRRNARPRFREVSGTYFATWGLPQGPPPLTAVERTLVAESLQHFDGVRYSLHAWVVMDDHVHVVVTPVQPWSLETVLHSWRSFAAHALLAGGREAPIWRRDGHDRIVRADGELAEKVAYVARNPWRRWPEAGRYQWVFPIVGP